MILVHDRDLAGALRRFEDRLAVERRDCAQVKDVALDTLCRHHVGRLERFVQHQPEADDRHVVTLAAHRRSTDLPSGGRFWDLFAEKPVNPFVLHEDHRVGIGERGQQQGLGVAGRRGRHDLETGHVGKQRLEALRVVEAAVYAAAVGRPHHERHLPGALAAVARFGRFRDQLIDRRQNEVHELDLDDRPQIGQGEADAHAGEPRFGERCIDHSGLAELVTQPLRDAEYPTGFDIFAQDDHPLVGGHRLAQTAADRLGHRHLAHAPPPNRWSSRVAGSGSADDSARPSAWRTSSSASRTN